MTDLTRERLAELRAAAESVHHPFRWYVAHDLMRGHAMADEDAHLIAAMSPSMCLTLIAQCEAGLPASGGVSGEDGELIAGLRAYQDRLNGAREVLDTPDTPMAPMPQTVGAAADRIVALLAERDGLKAELAQSRKARDFLGETFDAGSKASRDALSASSAALADALGLLERWYFAAADKTLGPFTETAEFLAKHGPSP